jgi:CHAT domain-containing protein
VLHFATHAYEDPRDPAGGGLLLAGEVPVLSPAGVETLGVAMDLVTLAGCGTLGTLAHPGEGTFGLARAFLVSGARTVVTTRWAVSDRAASRFMEAFYGGLRAGRARDTSLGEARAQLAAAGFPPRDCWAFALLGVGDRPLEQWAAREGGKSGPLSK